jgi:hypothetical protein
MPKKIEKKRINKSAFVRGLPLTLSAAEVVAAAKKSGIKISEKYCYNARSKARTANGTAKRKPGRPPSKVNGSKVAAGVSRDESVFLDMALDMGLGRAEALLKRVRGALATALEA